MYNENLLRGVALMILPALMITLLGMTIKSVSVNLSNVCVAGIIAVRTMGLKTATHTGRPEKV